MDTTAVISNKIKKIQSLYLNDLYSTHIEDEYEKMVNLFSGLFASKQRILENITRFNSPEFPRFMVYTDFEQEESGNFKFSYQLQVLISTSSQVFTFYYDNRVDNRSSEKLAEQIEFISEECYFIKAKHNEMEIERELVKYGYTRLHSSLYDKSIGSYYQNFEPIKSISATSSVYALLFDNIMS